MHIVPTSMALAVLACTSAQEPPATNGPASASSWKIHAEESPIDDSKTVTLSLDAEEDVSGWPDRRVRPRLVVRHKEGQIDLYVVTGLATHPEGGRLGESTCTVRIDKKAASTFALNTATSNDSLFFEGATNWIRSMAKAERMVFRFTPYNSSPQTAVFRLNGLSTAIRAVEEASGWRMGSCEDLLSSRLAFTGRVLSRKPFNSCLPSEGQERDLGVNLLVGKGDPPEMLAGAFNLVVMGSDDKEVSATLPDGWGVRVTLYQSRFKGSGLDVAPFIKAIKKAAEPRAWPEGCLSIDVSDADSQFHARVDYTGIPRHKNQ